MRDYPKLFAILKKNDLLKDEVALDVSNNRTKSLSALTDQEFNQLMTRLEPLNKIPPGDLMRKKIISMARQMRWVDTSSRAAYAKVDLMRIDNWCIKYGKFHKPLMSHTVPELTVIVTVFESVLSDFFKGINHD